MAINDGQYVDQANLSASLVPLPSQPVPQTPGAKNLNTVNRRPFLFHIGNSFPAQDYPVADTLYSATTGNVTLGGSTNITTKATSLGFYLHAVCKGAFDVPIFDYAASTINSNSTARFTNGVYGASGKELVGLIENSIDQLIPKILAACNGAPWYVILTPFENDMNNNGATAGYWRKVFRSWKRVIAKILAAGGVPITQLMAPSTFCNTANHAANVYALRDACLAEAALNSDNIVVNCTDLYRDTAQVNGYPYPLSFVDDAEAIAITGDATYGKKYSLFNTQADANSNGGLHPNARNQCLRAIKIYEALIAHGRVRMEPPLITGNLSYSALAENSTFEATTGTAVGAGTNVAAGSSTNNKAWTPNSYGANTQIKVTDDVGADLETRPRVTIYPTSAASVNDFCGLAGTIQASSILVGGVSVLRFFERVKINKALNMRFLTRQIRINGGTYTSLGLSSGSTSDTSDNPKDNQKGWRNAPGMLEGRELVFASYAFYADPSLNHTVRNIGGGVTDANMPFTAIGDAANSGSDQTVIYANLQIVA